ncbi:MAG TPA: beta-ketoacyl synthase chain length factor [Gammaproteobacteria bacterium]|nr:beta-ketoacyl synthase chain length factor [Gammaproteobacteria bacterium]
MTTGSERFRNGADGALAIARWQAWTPDAREDGDWAAWFEGRRNAQEAAQPDVSFLPAMLRRRLERSGRMSLAVAAGALGKDEKMATIFASRHGPFHRTMELLAALARDEPISPTLFSLGVHNSVAGLFSIARADRSTHTSVAAGAATLAAAFWEAAGQLAGGAPAVLIVYVSEPPPAMYQPYIGAEEPLLAFAAVLEPARADVPAWRLRREDGIAMGEDPALALLRSLCHGSDRAVLAPGWLLARASAHA